MQLYGRCSWKLCFSYSFDCSCKKTSKEFPLRLILKYGWVNVFHIHAQYYERESQESKQPHFQRTICNYMLVFFYHVSFSGTEYLRHEWFPHGIKHMKSHTTGYYRMYRIKIALFLPVYYYSVQSSEDCKDIHI